MDKNKQPQNQDPQTRTAGVLPTPAHKAVAAAMAAGALVAGVKANPNGVSTSPSVERGKPAIAVVARAAEPSSSKTIELSDGRTATIVNPGHTASVLEFAEDGKDGLKAATAFGNPIAGNFPVPTADTQPAGSPQQAHDPNKEVTFTPAPDDNPYTNDILDPVTITEDGKGGLEAERNGEPIEGVIHMGFDGTAGFTETGTLPEGHATGQPPFMNTDHNGNQVPPTPEQ